MTRYVAPYVGAWIETLIISLHVIFVKVAPYVGAWIETYGGAWQYADETVAPYVGAWIETCSSMRNALMSWSHPTWVRGLKHTARIISATVGVVV